MRTFFCLLAILFFAAPAVGREIYVDNVAGNDQSTGLQLRDVNGRVGAVRTLGHALQLARSGDVIVLAKTKAPYRESISLVGSRHGGTSEQPFVIRGNGAILDGSAPATAEMWESYQGAIFRLRSRPMGYPQLFLDGQPALRVSVAQAARMLPDLQPQQWCSLGGQIYFCVEKGKLPGDYRLSYAHRPTGITLFRVEHVRIADLVVQGFQVDGIQLCNSPRDVLLTNVTCRGNGRSGIAVGGASLALIDVSLLVSNGAAQLLTLPASETYLRKTRLRSNTAPGWVDQGGRVYVDGRRVEGGLDDFPPAAAAHSAREPKP
jgi:hypothetical protein